MEEKNPYKAGTYNWYKYEIRKLTPQANQRIVEAEASGKTSPQFDAIVKRLQKYGSTRKSVSDTAVGLGFQGKTKSLLKRQYQELKRMLKIDVWSPQGLKQAEEAEKTSYNAFIANRPGWTKEKWREFVQTMGTVSSEMLREFGYERHGNDRGSKTVSVNKKASSESFINAFEEAYDSGQDMQSIMEEVNAKSRGAGLEADDQIDLLYTVIRDKKNNKATDYATEIAKLKEKK